MAEGVLSESQANHIWQPMAVLDGNVDRHRRARSKLHVAAIGMQPALLLWRFYAPRNWLPSSSWLDGPSRQHKPAIASPFAPHPQLKEIS